MTALWRMFGLPRGFVHRWAAVLAIFAMLGQSAVFTLHKPALALSPFGADEHALCLSSSTASGAPEDGQKAPLGNDLQCPICKTLQHVLAILPPHDGLCVAIAFRADAPAPNAEVFIAQASSPAQPRAPPGL